LDPYFFCVFRGQDLDVLGAVVMAEAFVSVKRVGEDGADVGILEP
jgi:hypothetical protein